MICFAITTSSKRASLSLFENGILLSEINVEVKKTHSTTILDQVDKLFTWSNKNINDTNKVLVSVGPGSFTGVRIAISVVKGLFWGKNVEFYSINELDALTYQAMLNIENVSKENATIVSLIDAGKEKIYLQISKMIYSENTNKKIETNTFHVKNDIEKVSNINEVIELLQSDEYLGNESSDNIYFIGDGSFKHEEKIKKEIKFDNKCIFLNYSDIKIKSTTFYKMYETGMLTSTDIYNLIPNYLEKTQAEKDKENKMLNK